MSVSQTPIAEIADEAHRILGAASAAEVPLRLIGGLAVLFHADSLHPALVRAYKDIDLATPKGQSRKVAELMTSLGYEPAKEFNALNGSRRLLFYDLPNERQVDVFVGTFEMRAPLARPHDDSAGRAALDQDAGRRAEREGHDRHRRDPAPPRRRRAR
jgi:hypothetical protein